MISLNRGAPLHGETAFSRGYFHAKPTLAAAAQAHRWIQAPDRAQQRIGNGQGRY
jgi:hypothetical protein